jgi:hypothetical protein
MPATPKGLILFFVEENIATTLHYDPRLEGVSWSSVAPCIIIPSTKWRGLISFTPFAPYPEESQKPLEYEVSRAKNGPMENSMLV